MIEYKYPLNTFSGETKRELVEFLKRKEEEKVEGIKKQIQEDLDAGQYSRICSNETTFKEYIYKLLETDEKH